MNNIEIVLLKKERAKELSDLYRKTVESDFKEWTQESKNKWLEEDYSPDYWRKLLTKGKLPVFAAFDGDKMVGYVVLEGIIFGVAYLGWVGVLKKYQGGGIGRKLMQSMEDWCRRKGLHKIELETQREDLVSFFKKQGYILEGIRKNSWQRLDNYMFGKDL